MRRPLVVAGLVALIAMSLLSFTTSVGAVEYDCGTEIVCEPEENQALPGCNFGAEWGSLTGSVSLTGHLNRSPTGTAAAAVTPIGNELLERWIVTSCSTVIFRPYAPWTGSVDGMDFCLDGQGEPGRPTCAAWTANWVQNKALNPGTSGGGSAGVFCGGLVCNPASGGTVDHSVGGISISQPFGRSVPVVGNAYAAYQEDIDGDGRWSDESPYHDSAHSETVTFRIGATP